MGLPAAMLALVFLVASCNEEQQRSVGVMPGSAGAHDELLVVIDDSTWNGSVGDSIRKYFRASYMVLPQNEPIFSVRQTTYDKFKDLFKKFRNVLFVGALEKDNPTAGHIKDVLGDEYRDKAMEKEGFHSFVKRDVWAKPQLLCYLFAPDTETLGQVIHNNHQRFIELFQDEELAKYKSVVYFEGVNEELTERVGDKFNINLKIPEGYKKAMDKKNFMWLRYDDEESIINIMISAEPYTAENKRLVNRGLEWRNRLGKQHIESTKEGSFMTTDTILGPISERTKLNGYPGWENRGLWRMANDFMGGPFLNYYLLDRKNKQELFIEGFVYAPSKDKKKLMRQIEAIFSTFSIKGWKPKS